MCETVSSCNVHLHTKEAFRVTVDFVTQLIQPAPKWTPALYFISFSTIYTIKCYYYYFVVNFVTLLLFFNVGLGTKYILWYVVSRYVIHAHTGNKASCIELFRTGLIQHLWADKNLERIITYLVISNES